MLSYFTDILDRPRQLLYLPNRWKRWATADREPTMQWTQGCITLLGDAAHPMLQYLAQGACMALEDAVTLGEAVREARGDFARAFAPLPACPHHSHRARDTDGARDRAHIYHAKGVERLVRNELWKRRTPDQRSSGFKAGAPSAAWTRVRNSCIDCERKESEAA